MSLLEDLLERRQLTTVEGRSAATWFHLCADDGRCRRRLCRHWTVPIVV